MIDLHGPAPEEMKKGEIYRVVEDKEHGGFRLDKVESGKGHIVVLELPPKVAYLYKIYAAILENTLEGKILEDLQERAESLDDGYVLGEEIKAACEQQFGKEPDQAPSS